MSKFMTRLVAPAVILAAVTAFSALSVHAQQDEPAAAPALPTTGDGAAVVRLLNGVCRPFFDGKGSFDQLATASGMTKDKNSENYLLPLSQRPYQISMRKPSNQNLTVCEISIVYAPGWENPIIDAMNTWRFIHSPQLHLQRSQIATFRDAKRTTLTWDNWENQGDDGIMVGLTFNKVANTDGTALVRGADSALIQYQVRTPLPEMIVAARERKAAEAKAKLDYEKAKADYDKQMLDYQAAVKAQADAQAAAAAAPAPAAPVSTGPDPLAAQYQAALAAQAGAAAPK